MKRNRTIILALRRMMSVNNRNILNSHIILDQPVIPIMEFPVCMMEFLESVCNNLYSMIGHFNYN